METSSPGLVALFGSGETAPASGAIYELLARRTRPPLNIALLETPAGFQPNSARVAGKVAEFLGARLQNYHPTISILPARKRGTPFDPDMPEVSAPLGDADLIFLGPGSPSYAARQLNGSLAWRRVIARHRHGACLATASAATIALGALVLPVYEIYKVGDDPHWQEGLDFFGPYGLRLALLPHWNNAEGGADLDTTRCFMGQERYEQLLALLPPDVAAVGIDEHTALVLDLGRGAGQVLGRGGVTVVQAGRERHFERASSIDLAELGELRLPEPAEGIPPEVWSEMAPRTETPAPPPAVPDEALVLVEERQDARARRDWAAADALRGRLAALGWSVRDTPGGPVLEPLG
jgi:hypothetical protein